jgi:hypothetical protein
LEKTKEKINEKKRENRKVEKKSNFLEKENKRKKKENLAKKKNKALWITVVIHSILCVKNNNFFISFKICCNRCGAIAMNIL